MKSINISVVLFCTFSSVANASDVTIGENGIHSVGLSLPNGNALNGSGIAIGQVEGFRPGDAGVGDDLAHRNTTTDPTGVFIQNIPGNAPPNTVDVHSHAQEVAGVMISTDTTDTSPNDDPFDPAHPELFTANGVAPTGVAPGASLYSAAYVTLGTNPGYEDAIVTFQRIWQALISCTTCYEGLG